MEASMIKCESSQHDLRRAPTGLGWARASTALANLRLTSRMFRDVARKRFNRLRPVKPSRLIMLACTIALFIPSVVQARDLVVFGEPTLEKALRAVGNLWQARVGTRVNVFVAPTDLSYAQIERGARCDVIFALAGGATEEAARAKIIQVATITRALRNGLVLVGTEGAAWPIDSANVADISRLIAGKRLAIANPERDPAGARALELLRKIGIAVNDDNRALAVPEN
jgi:ABC-type molybdate transport system substrate-binding protein